MSGQITKFDGDFRFLSNFYNAGFRDEYGFYWPTSEHFYQAHKTVLPHEQTWVRECSSPGKAKRLGKQVTLREDWEEVKIQIMQRALFFKFAQNPVCARALVKTNPLELIEGNTWGDVYWGMCNGKGKNMLGKLLMELRSELLKYF